jgi:hypothetical protein
MTIALQLLVFVAAVAGLVCFGFYRDKKEHAGDRLSSTSSPDPQGEKPSHRVACDVSCLIARSFGQPGIQRTHAGCLMFKYAAPGLSTVIFINYSFKNNWVRTCPGGSCYFYPECMTVT